MDKKKMVAAMAAVYTYIRTGEEAAAAAAQAPQEAAAKPSPPSGTAQMNVWGLSGRQAIMNAANMMQLRMFK